MEKERLGRVDLAIAKRLLRVCLLVINKDGGTVYDFVEKKTRFSQLLLAPKSFMSTTHRTPRTGSSLTRKSENSGFQNRAMHVEGQKKENWLNSQTKDPSGSVRECLNDKAYKIKKSTDQKAHEPCQEYSILQLSSSENMKHQVAQDRNKNQK